MTNLSLRGGLRAPSSGAPRRRPPSRWRPYAESAPFVAPAWVLVILVGVIPICYTVWLSLTDQNLTATSNGFVGFQNFMRSVFQPTFLDSLVVTATFIVACTVVQFVIGYALAHFLHLQLRGHQLARSVLLIPMLLTPVVIGLVFNYMFSPGLGIISEALNAVGVHIRWFDDTFWGKTFIVLLDSWLFIPFVMLMLLAGMAGIPKDQLEAASLDGAGWWKKTRYVTLPALAPVMAVALMLRVVETARMFDQVYSSTRGGPGTSTVTVSFLIYNQTFTYYQFGFGAAMAIALTVLMSPIYFGYIRLTRI